MKLFDNYINLKYKLYNEYNAQFVSNAWLKCYEMLSEFKLLKNNDIVFFNAELPGSFISATNHYAKTNNINYDWIASSFIDKDKDSNILGDRYNLYKNYKDKWIMNDDMNGDLMNIFNLNKIKNIIHSRFNNGVDLYFSDAGSFIGDNYSDQEEINSLLNLSQVICGLSILKTGGTMVTKTYTLFAPLNISIIYYYNLFFDKVFIVKPKTSRPTNSELYILAQGFKGINDTDLDFLYSSFTILKNYDFNIASQFSLINYNISHLNQIESICKYIFIDNQMKNIEKIIHLIDSNRFIHISKVRHLCENNYIIDNNIKVLNNNDKLINNPN
jgi:23S rRNA U2552 (ribose-2'-O)-methylase RlmE/FtsJ